MDPNASFRLADVDYQTTSVLVCLTDVAVQSDCMFKIEVLKSILPKSSRMAPTVALCFALGGIGV